MEGWLHVVAKHTIVTINAMALLVIIIGTIEAFVFGLRALARRSLGTHDSRLVSQRYGRWLVTGLTFQLAADIIETSITPTWEDIGKLAAIALIRTFLSYVLERELAEMRPGPDEDVRPTPTG
jgi:uncharacterized membrane protein